MRVLAGDIGGTNARLAIVDVDEDAARLLYKRRFASRDSSALAPIVPAFLAEVADTPSRACIAIACPGHTSLSARNDVEWGLLGSLANSFGHVSWERVVSGPGLVSIYQYLAAAGEVEERARHNARVGSCAITLPAGSGELT